ncbi:hypothetical protein R1flu_014726 [Riccia fluitans]|uniref:F-box domain-containing protein n=1 Tax=Riccia fluitans TaxID=41844 RepID=A0ABD1YHQ3_9MARC
MWWPRNSEQVTPQPTGGGGSDWSEMSRDLLELILLKLPEVSLIRSGGVCKSWSSIARAENFRVQYVKQMTESRAWLPFTVKGSRYFFQQNAVREYDDLAPFNSCAVPYLLQPDGKSFCQEGAGGIFYFFAGLDDTVLHYKISLVQPDWLVTPEMSFRKHDPIVGLLRTGVDGAHKLVVAGGIGEGSDEDLTVEIYDSETKTWEVASPLPSDTFRGCTSSVFMNPAVYNGKFYAYDNCGSMKCSVFDLESNTWSEATEVGRPKEMNSKYSYLVENSSGLSLVAIQNAGTRDLSFSAWEVDPESLQVSEEKTDDTIILNSQPPPPSNFKKFSDRIFDVLCGVMGLMLLILVHIIVMSYGLYIRSRCRLKNVLRLWHNHMSSKRGEIGFSVVPSSILHSQPGPFLLTNEPEPSRQVSLPLVSSTLAWSESHSAQALISAEKVLTGGFHGKETEPEAFRTSLSSRIVAMIPFAVWKKLTN